MTRIHPTAVIDERAQLADDVIVGAKCVVGGPVVMGAGCVLHPQAMVTGHTTMGAGNIVYPGAVVGAEPQDLKYDGEPTRLEIGDRNRFREHVTVHPGTLDGGGLTRIGSDNLFMVGSHVAHDCRLGNRIVLANHVLLAGHIQVGDRAILNGAAACHHFTTIGRLAYVGGLTRITQDVHPFTIVEGHPARIRGCNVIGMRRSGLGEEDVQRVKDAVRSIFLSKRSTAADAIADLEAQHGDDPLIAELLASIRAADAGRQGRAAEALAGAGLPKAQLPGTELPDTGLPDTGLPSGRPGAGAEYRASRDWVGKRPSLGRAQRGNAR